MLVARFDEGASAAPFLRHVVRSRRMHLAKARNGLSIATARTRHGLSGPLPHRCRRLRLHACDAMPKPTARIVHLASSQITSPRASRTAPRRQGRGFGISKPPWQGSGARLSRRRGGDRFVTPMYWSPSSSLVDVRRVRADWALGVVLFGSSRGACRRLRQRPCDRARSSRAVASARQCCPGSSRSSMRRSSRPEKNPISLPNALSRAGLSPFGRPPPAKVLDIQLIVPTVGRDQPPRPSGRWTSEAPPAAASASLSLRFVPRVAPVSSLSSKEGPCIRVPRSSSQGRSGARARSREPRGTPDAPTMASSSAGLRLSAAAAERLPRVPTSRRASRPVAAPAAPRPPERDGRREPARTGPPTPWAAAPCRMQSTRTSVNDDENLRSVLRRRSVPRTCAFTSGESRLQPARASEAMADAFGQARNPMRGVLCRGGYVRARAQRCGSAGNRHDAVLADCY